MLVRLDVLTAVLLRDMTCWLGGVRCLKDHGWLGGVRCLKDLGWLGGKLRFYLDSQNFAIN
jgi:hypothetical protein